MQRSLTWAWREKASTGWENQSKKETEGAESQHSRKEREHASGAGKWKNVAEEGKERTRVSGAAYGGDPRNGHFVG